MPKNQEPRKQKLLSILKEQNHCCAISGRQLTPNTAAVDHKVPILRGGAVSDFNNLQILHNDINRAKGNLTDQEFIGMCREVVKKNVLSIRSYSLAEYVALHTDPPQDLFTEAMA